MKRILLICVLVILAGCASVPMRPVECVHEWTVIEWKEWTAPETTIDLTRYEAWTRNITYRVAVGLMCRRCRKLSLVPHQ